jgi:signal transduction histidine kinase
MESRVHLDKRRLRALTVAIVLIFISSIAVYAYWADLRYREQIRSQLLERARMLSSQYVDYEKLRPFIMKRSKEEVLYQVKLVSLNLIIGIGMPDKFEIAALQRFTADPKLAEIYAEDHLMGEEVFRYLKPFKINGSPAAVSLIISKESLLSAYRENMVSLLTFSGAMLLITSVLVGFLLLQLTGLALDLDAKNEALVKLQNFKEELTRLLVHDLKNPLAGMMESLAIMKEGLVGQLTEDQRTLVVTSKQAADRLLLMIMNILDIAKMKEGKLELNRRPLDLKAFLEKVVKKQGEPAVRDKKAIILVSAFSDPKIPADEIILERVLDNLISNALKHTVAGEGKVEVGAIYDEKEKLARINVKDNGEGIPPEYLDKVFDEFVQVESRQLGTKLDTGLGLTFCKLAVEAHKGKIRVISEVGQGSNFIFTLPL